MSPETVAIAHQHVGSGPPLLVLHGLFGSGTNWRRIARGLEDCRTVHLLDARNHGASPHAPDMDYRLLAADVTAWMDREGIDRADVIGHSMGGKTAMPTAPRITPRDRATLRRVIHSMNNAVSTPTAATNRMVS